ncbi:hypothetical protein [Deinococcus ruber]|uniref:Uncharacterized protein n=1 Tax=Deinococcus ruber TaxID=1848197 RepID=A0A918FHA4_9DEIO|nr:hypothetical protein [Deinococcus ruber]GGR37565.1 hypothetical protein GCM10008957_53740 [Deinococcus ruber]
MNAAAVLQFLQQEASGSQHLDVNERLHLFEISWAAMVKASVSGNREESLAWADRGIRVCANEPWCEENALNMRTWAIDEFGHQDEHAVLDATVLVKDFFHGLTWTPEEAVHAARVGWVNRDRDLLMTQRRLKRALIRLERIHEQLPQEDRFRLQAWFAVRNALK